VSQLPVPQPTAADRLSPEIIRKRLDYWTLILGPKFSAKERKQLNLSRFYAISQIKYCRNFIFRPNFPIHKLLERSCELGLWRLTANKIAAIFGSHLHRRQRGRLATVSWRDLPMPSAASTHASSRISHLSVCRRHPVSERS
jgi:hypothetical protein